MLVRGDLVRVGRLGRGRRGHGDHGDLVRVGRGDRRLGLGLGLGGVHDHVETRLDEHHLDRAVGALRLHAPQELALLRLVVDRRVGPGVVDREVALRLPVATGVRDVDELVAPGGLLDLDLGRLAHGRRELVHLRLGGVLGVLDVPGRSHHVTAVVVDHYHPGAVPVGLARGRLEGELQEALVEPGQPPAVVHHEGDRRVQAEADDQFAHCDVLALVRVRVHCRTSLLAPSRMGGVGYGNELCQLPVSTMPTFSLTNYYTTKQNICQEAQVMI